MDNSKKEKLRALQQTIDKLEKEYQGEYSVYVRDFLRQALEEQHKETMKLVMEAVPPESNYLYEDFDGWGADVSSGWNNCREQLLNNLKRI